MIGQSPGPAITKGDEMTEAEFMQDNQELLRAIVEASHKYRKAGDWDALLMLARTLNAGAQACFEVFSLEGYVTKELTINDVLKRNH